MERIHLKLLKRNESLPVNRKGGCSFALAQIREDYLHLRQAGACSVFLYRAGKFSPVLVPQAAPRKEYLPLFPDNALGLPGDLQMEKRKFLLESADIVGICSGGVDWEGESFQQNFRQQIGFRESGEDLSSLTAHLVENADLSQQGWNRTLVLFEKT